MLINGRGRDTRYVICVPVRTKFLESNTVLNDKHSKVTVRYRYHTSTGNGKKLLPELQLSKKSKCYLRTDADSPNDLMYSSNLRYNWTIE